MKISINIFDKKSVKNAVNQLRKQQKQIKKMFGELLVICCDWFIERANFYLEQSNIGSSIIERIKLSWGKTITGDKAVITNIYSKAVFVEFGVGIVGQENPHENAGMAGYDYNIPSPYKKDDGSWSFYANNKEMNIPPEDLEQKIIFNDPSRNSERMFVSTRGTKGVMYAYNALLDLQMEVPKLWDKIKNKYWG